jgi:ferredoxin--NADP+ reductase
MEKWIEGSVVSNHQWNDQLFSLNVNAPIEGFEAGQFTRLGLAIGGDLVDRPYSFVNAPGQHPLEFFYVTVPGGPLTEQLVNLREGDPILVSTKSQGMLVLSRVPKARDLWLLSSGTAVGPFLSILRTEEPWERFERVLLAHSVRNVADLTHRSIIEELSERHGPRFEFVPLVTREATDFALPTRIPSAIEDGSLERRAGTSIDPSLSQAMICGSSDMVKDTRAALEKRGLRRNLRSNPGHITVESYF